MRVLNHDPDKTVDWSPGDSFIGCYARDAGDIQPLVHRVGRVASSRWFGEQIPNLSGGHLENRLTGPVTVACDDFSATMPEDFIFDGASIRYRWAGPIIPRWGVREVEGAKVHDLFYSDYRHMITHLEDPRLWADRLLYWLWRAAGVPWHRARMGYRAVRLFGGRVWDRGAELGFDRPEMTKIEIVRAGRGGEWLDPKLRRAA